MTLTEKYQSKYLPGFDCRMTTFRNTLACTYGHRLSNGMIVGLSGCLTLVYGKPKTSRLPFYTLAGLSDQSLEGLSTVFGTYLTHSNFELDDEDLVKKIQEHLYKGNVVNVAINRPLLMHLTSGKDLSSYEYENSNVGFHYVSITEIDDHQVTFFETDRANPMRMDFDLFKRCWFFDDFYDRKYSDPFQKCNGQYYVLQGSCIKAHENENSLRFAIDKVVQSYFLENNGFSAGITALNEFFQGILEWEQNDDLELLLDSMELIYILESFLSGGGFGRGLYSFFLAETSRVLNDTSLKNIAFDFKETSKLWTKFIREVCDYDIKDAMREKDFGPFNSVTHKHAEKLIRAETEQFRKLEDWLNTN